MTAALENSAMGNKQHCSTNKGREVGLMAYTASQRKKSGVDGSTPGPVPLPGWKPLPWCIKFETNAWGGGDTIKIQYDSVQSL